MKIYRVVYECRPVGTLGRFDLRVFFVEAGSTSEALAKIRADHPDLEFRFVSEREEV